MILSTPTLRANTGCAPAQPRPQPHRLREIHDPPDAIAQENESRLKVPRN
jgi:hypothetical protein